MPSRDTFSKRQDSELRAELGLSAPERQRETEPTAKRPVRPMSAQVQRLARRVGKSPDEIAARISEDTLRRSKYPVVETVNEDGTRSFKHDPLIEEGRKAEVRP